MAFSRHHHVHNLLPNTYCINCYLTQFHLQFAVISYSVCSPLLRSRDFDMSCAGPKLPLAMETEQALPAHEPILTRMVKLGKNSFSGSVQHHFHYSRPNLTVAQHCHKLWNQLSQLPEAIVTYTHRLKLAPFRRRPHCIIRSLGIRGSTRS
jgi:hypothetical protein